MRKVIKSDRPTQCQSCSAHNKSPFRNLLPGDCKRIDSIREMRSFDVGEQISFREKKEDGFYCLRQGHWKVGLKQPMASTVVRIAGPGDIIGFGNWLKSSQEHIAEALDPSEACFFSSKIFLETQRRSQAIAEGVIEALCRIIDVKDKRISGLETTTVKSRVAASLLTLSEKFGVSSEHGLKIDVKIDRRTIAALAGTVVETLSRILTELEEDGLIKRQKRTIYLLEPRKLKELLNQGKI